jgi:UrcA family protein
MEGTTMKKIVSLAVAAAAVIGASSATAQSVQIDQDGNYKVKVAYGDLDLTSDAGKQALEARVNVAAKRVCGAAYGSAPTTLRTASECRGSVLNAAQLPVATALAAAGAANSSVASGR